MHKSTCASSCARRPACPHVMMKWDGLGLSVWAGQGPGGAWVRGCVGAWVRVVVVAVLTCNDG